MRLSDLKFELDAPGRPCIVAWPLAVTGVEGLRVLSLPLLQRPGGFLLALPSLLQPSVAEDALAEEPLDALGPAHIASTQTVEEDEVGEEVPTGLSCQVLLLDVEEAFLEYMALFDPVTDQEVISFVEGSPQLVPHPEEVMAAARAWLESETAERLAFYTAPEDPEGLGPVLPKPAAKKAQPSKKRVTMAQLSEQVASLAGLLPGLIDEVKGVVERQNRLEQASAAQASPAAPLHQQPFPQPGVGAHAKGLGALAKQLQVPAKMPLPNSSPPPPKVTVPPAAEPCGSGDSSLAKAVSQQGEALSLLVSHLVAQGESLDFGTSSASVSGKGTARRERLQNELASGSSTFFLQVAQGAHRRLFPALPCPTSLEDIRGQGRLSLVTYLERQGGYNQQKSMGLFMLMLATIGDAFLRGDNHAAMEHLGLALAATEQAAADNGRWELGFLLTLLEDPAPTLFSARSATANTRLRAFSPLVPQPLAAVTLTYVREVDLLAQRRKDAVQPGRANQGNEEEESAKAEPKGRRPRYPRKPKET